MVGVEFIFFNQHPWRLAKSERQQMRILVAVVEPEEIAPNRNVRGITDVDHAKPFRLMIATLSVQSLNNPITTVVDPNRCRCPVGLEKRLPFVFCADRNGAPSCSILSTGCTIYK